MQGASPEQLMAIATRAIEELRKATLRSDVVHYLLVRCPSNACVCQVCIPQGMPVDDVRFLVQTMKGKLATELASAGAAAAKAGKATG